MLVHCLAGVSRSVTVTLAYLMQTESISLNEAFSLVRSRKPDVSPNFDFMQQLNSFEQEIGISMENDCKTKQKNADQPKHELQIQYEPISVENSLLKKLSTTNNAKTGVSPDSGIEFDRWTSSDLSEGNNNLK